MFSLVNIGWTIPRIWCKIIWSCGISHGFFLFMDFILSCIYAVLLLRSFYCLSNFLNRKGKRKKRELALCFCFCLLGIWPISWIQMKKRERRYSYDLFIYLFSCKVRLHLLISCLQFPVQGKTVEVGRAHFETETTRFTILDAPVTSLTNCFSALPCI